jgi:shikimate 5-dehydrogenase
MTARERGVPVVDGVEFLVLQAAASFSLWTGRKAPLDVMLAAARKP